jgi:DNA-binding winged helix-turn-helix (wHTH) protein
MQKFLLQGWKACAMSFSPGDFYRFDEFELSRSRRTLLRNGQPVALLPRTFEVLTCLVENPGRVVEKEEILKAVWHRAFVEENNLTQHISLLRKALADRGRCIATIPGRGYQLTASVITAPLASASVAVETEAAPAVNSAVISDFEPALKPGRKSPTRVSSFLAGLLRRIAR